MINKVDVIFLFLISLFSIVIGLLDFFGLIGHIPWLNSSRIQALWLVFLSILGFHFLIRYSKSEKMKKKQDKTYDLLETLMSQCNNVITKTFNDSAELESYISRRISCAKIEILDLTWKKNWSGEEILPKRKIATRKYDDSIKKISKNVSYKEIFVFDQFGRKDKLKRRLLENNPGYSCSYYLPSDIPRIQFIIIDKKEILFVSSFYELKATFFDDKLITIFRKFFYEAWSDAIKIKEANNIRVGELEKIFENKELEILKRKLKL